MTLAHPVCPIDGGTVADEGIEYLVCQTCREMLAPLELVSRATRRTRRNYERSMV